MCLGHTIRLDMWADSVSPFRPSNSQVGATKTHRALQLLWGFSYLCFVLQSCKSPSLGWGHLATSQQLDGEQEKYIRYMHADFMVRSALIDSHPIHWDWATGEWRRRRRMFQDVTKSYWHSLAQMENNAGPHNHNWFTHGAEPSKWAKAQDLKPMLRNGVRPNTVTACTITSL